MIHIDKQQISKYNPTKPYLAVTLFKSLLKKQLYHKHPTVLQHSEIFRGTARRIDAITRPA